MPETDAGDGRRPGFKRSLGLFDATSMSVGAIIGAGIFVVTGIAAGLAGSALVVSMLIAAAISLFTALSIAELAAWKPVEGSIYEYTYRLVSPFAGFLVGWMWMLSNVFGGAGVSLSFAHYLKALVPALPAGGIAAVLCLAFTVINVLGVRESASLNNAIVVTKLLILTFFVIFGSLHVKAAHFAPFAPLHTGVLYGACFIFFAYGGFARVAIVAEEIRDAKRTVPRAILLSLGISTLVYMLVGTVAVGLVGAAGLSGSASPLTQAMKATRSAAASSVISVGALLATASVLLTAILGVSRMAYAMAKRKDLPSALGKLGARRGTPHVSIWISGALMALLALLVDLSKVVAISTFALLFYYGFANIAAWKLRPGKRTYPRLIPIAGAASCLVLSVFLLFASAQAWLAGVVGLAAGVAYGALRKGLR